MKIFITLILSFFILNGYSQERELVTVKKTLELMRSEFNISVVSPSKELGQINIEEAIAEIKRIEKMISSWNEESETFLVNKNAGIKPVKVSREFFMLIERCKQISELTDGAFDISYPSIEKVWNFDDVLKEIPSKEIIKESVTNVGFEKIVLNSDMQTVFLLKKGMKISFGAIGKGYAVDKAKEFLVSRQVVGGIIDAAGDLSTWGTDVKGDKWTIGIANPFEKDKIVSWLPILESSVATSGTNEKYVTFKGKEYSHIIDPRTGYPTSGVHQVSIFAKSAEFCDALATAVFIMGKKDGLFLINQLDGVEMILFDNLDEIHKSDGMLFETDPKP